MRGSSTAMFRRLSTMSLAAVCVTAAGLVSTATSAGATTAVSVACHDNAGFVAAIGTVIISRRRLVTLAGDCAYLTFGANNTSYGGSAFPVITKPVTIATVRRAAGRDQGRLEWWRLSRVHGRFRWNADPRATC